MMKILAPAALGERWLARSEPFHPPNLNPGDVKDGSFYVASET